MKIVIIGGGPVGLYASIKFKSKFKNADITIYEKRSVYTRDQILIVDSKIKNKFPPNLKKQLWGRNGLGCYSQLPWLTKTGRCYKNNSKNLYPGIVISSLEKVLLNYAKTLGIKIIKKTINTESLDIIQKNNDIVIGSDGMNSIVSQKMNAGINYYLPETYGMGVVFKYRKENDINENPSKINQHRYRGFRSKENKGYLGITLTLNEYKLLNSINNDKINKIIKNGLEYYNFGDVKMIKKFEIKINIYKRNKYSENNLFLIGDASFNTHYFTGSGVNNGFLEVNYLVNKIKKDNHDIHDDYHLFINKLLEKTKTKIQEVSIDFKKIRKECVKHNIDSLKRIAKKENINISNNKKELCYLLAKSKKIDKTSKKIKI